MEFSQKSRVVRKLSTEPANTLNRLIRRGEIQIEFARALQAILPAGETAGWADAIASAAARLSGYDAQGGIEALEAAVAAIESDLAAIGPVAKRYKVHCVGHGHIDMNWMWSWPETVSTTHDTFASVLSVMEQYPDVTYSQSQASVYAITEEYFPDLFEQIKARVKEGRWEITAAHWVEGEKNLASGESLCRHLLYTRDYFQKKFDLSPEDLPIDWEPDTFGHAITIPTILAQGGVKYYYSCRTGGGFEHPLIGDWRPALFYWQGPDGARILVNRETTWYNSYSNIGDNIALPLVNFVKETNLHDWLNVFGIGNHGGGPTRDEIDWYKYLQTFPIYPEITFSTNKRYFEAIENELGGGGGFPIPVITHELNFEFTGCYTSQSLIKQANRFGENYLEEAETLALLGERLRGMSVPHEPLRKAWINVLFNQFHDILPGSGVRQTREHAMALFQEVGAVTGAIKRNVTKALASRIDTMSLLPDTPDGAEERALSAAGGVNAAFNGGQGLGADTTGLSAAGGGGRLFRPCVVYNPTAWDRSEKVTFEIFDTGFSAANVVAIDDTGRKLPTTVLRTASGWAAWGHEQIRVAFDARDVPALGYRTYLLAEGTPDAPDTGVVNVYPQNNFETPWLKYQLDRDQSGLINLTDKRNGAVWANSATNPMAAWKFINERSKGMEAWILGREVDAPITLQSSVQFTGVEAEPTNGLTFGNRSDGYRISQTLKVPNTQSTVRITTVIHAIEPRIDFTAEINWREIGDPQRGIPGLTIAFPLPLTDIHSRYEAPFGSVDRTLSNGEEVPSLRYAHIWGTATTKDGGQTPAGITLLQDCKYGHSIEGNELRLRIVRSSYGPDPIPEVATTTVRYSLYFHEGEADPATLARLGAAWNHPLITFGANIQAGDAPTTASYARVLNDNVVLTAIKPALDGNGLVLRVVEMNGQDTEAVVELDAALTAGLSTATVLDLIERPVAGAATWNDGRLTVALKAHGFATVRLA